jgi:hypothetical protein
MPDVMVISSWLGSQTLIRGTALRHATHGAGRGSSIGVGQRTQTDSRSCLASYSVGIAGASREQSGWGVMLTTDPHLVLGLRMTETIPAVSHLPSWLAQGRFYGGWRSREKRLLSCPSAFPLVSARHPLHGYPWNLIVGASISICRETPNLVKFGHFTWTPKCVLLLPATLHRHKGPLFEWNDIRLLA